MNICMVVTNRAVDDVRVCMEAQALAKTGKYKVTVVGWDRDDSRESVENRGGIEFHRLHFPSTHARGSSQVYFLWRFWKRAETLICTLKPDAIHCHDLDTLPLGRRCAKKLRAKLIFDAHENFPDMMLGHLPIILVKSLRMLERNLVPKCDLLITVGNRLANHYKEIGARHVAVVGNWKDPKEYNFSSEQIVRTRQRLGLDGKIAICFIANLGRERHLEPLMNALAGHPKFACVIGGKGKLEGLARDFAARHENIHYLGQVPPEEVPLYTAACDVVYYGFDRSNPNSRWSAPNKLYEAIAAGKALLAGDFGEIGMVIRQHGCGLLVDTSSDIAIRQSVAQLAQEGLLPELAAKAKMLQGKYSTAGAAKNLEDAYARLF